MPDGVTPESSNTVSAIDGLVPIADLIVLEGELNGRPVEILEDDGCNTNVVSTVFARRNAHLFHIEDADISITHSKRDYTETARQVIVDGQVSISSHVYRSNWPVADCRYNVLLGMPWQLEKNPTVDYAVPSVAVDGVSLPLREFSFDSERRIKVTNIGMKRFRRLIGKKHKREDFQVFQLVEKGGFCKAKEEKQYDNYEERVKRLLSQYAELFQEDPPAGLPPDINTVVKYPVH